GGHHPQRLGIVVEPAEPVEAGIERSLARMAERRMAKIMSQRQGFGEILVEAERPRQRPGDLRHLEGVSEPRAIVIALVEHEDLGLVLEAAKRGRVDDTVAVAAERVARRAFGLAMQAAAARSRIGRIGRSRATGIDSHGSVCRLRLTGACRALNYRSWAWQY